MSNNSKSGHWRKFINVAYEIGLLKLDVQKLSHGLRDFRNYIHPYQQMASGFKPDEHTAQGLFPGTSKPLWPM